MRLSLQLYSSLLCYLCLAQLPSLRPLSAPKLWWRIRRSRENYVFSASDPVCDRLQWQGKPLAVLHSLREVSGVSFGVVRCYQKFGNGERGFHRWSHESDQLLDHQWRWNEAGIRPDQHSGCQGAYSKPLLLISIYLLRRICICFYHT